jgi:hypothetical protein
MSGCEPHLEVRERATGRFDELLVADVDGWRGLWSGELCHGSAYLEPQAEIDGCALRPGPVPEASYLLAWLLPALRHRHGSVLMAGLGCGAGITVLLHHFPELRITVAEIDDEVIRLADAHFPLLRHHRERGRVEVVSADIHDLVARRSGERWSLALLDAYQRDERLYCPQQLLASLRPRVDELWVNVVDDEGQPRVRRMIERLAAAGWPARTVVPVHGVDDEGEYATDNHLVGTAPLERDALDGFVPFAGCTHARAIQARGSYRAMSRRLRELRPAAHRPGEGAAPDRLSSP